MSSLFIKNLTLSIFLFCTLCANSQTAKDSIEVTEEVNRIYAIRLDQPEVAKKSVLKLMGRTKKYNNKIHLAKAFSLMAVLYDDDADYSNAHLNNDSAVYYYGLAKFPLGQAMVHKNDGLVFQKAGEYQKSLQTYIKGLRIVDSIKDNRVRYFLYNNLGLLYNEMGQYDESISYYEKALKYNIEKKDSGRIAQIYQNIAVPYELKGDLKKAEECYKQSIEICKKTNNINVLAICYDNLGGIYITQKNYKEALHYHLMGYELNKQINNDAELALIANNVSEAYLLMNDLPKAKTFADEALSIALKSNIIKEQGRAYHNFAGYYTQLGQHKAANEYFQKEINAFVPLFNDAMAKSNSEMMIKYQAEKKENENKQLQQQNDIHKLEIENNEQKIKSKNQLILLLGISFLLVLIIVFWQISLARNRKQKAEIDRREKIQQERGRISRDLHDSVGGQLSYVLFSLEGMKNENEAEVEKTKNITAAVRNVISDLRQTIWAINDDKLSLHDLSDKIKVYTKNLFNNSDVKLNFEESISQNVFLSSVTVLNLFRSCQEIINNAFKHSKCSLLVIKISYNASLKIEITDNGIGFSDTESQEGYGLKNIQTRIKEINGTIDISSTKNGTSYTIMV